MAQESDEAAGGAPLPGAEPSRTAPSAELSRRMSRLPRRDNARELTLRRLLHAGGLRYRVHYPLPGNRRRSIDVAFPRQQVAVFLDGCFWHSCPEHGVQPVTNAEWWRWKLATVRTRDADTNRLLSEQGWTVLRFWEHEDLLAVATAVKDEVRGS